MFADDSILDQIRNTVSALAVIFAAAWLGWAFHEGDAASSIAAACVLVGSILLALLRVKGLIHTNAFFVAVPLAVGGAAINVALLLS